MHRTLLVLSALATFAAPRAAARDPAEIRRAQRFEVAAAAAGELPFEADILNGFAKALGVTIRVSPAGSVAGALQAVAEGRADVAAGGIVSPRDRRAGIVFTAEVFPTRLVALNRAPAEPFRFIESLRTAEKILAPAATGAAEAASAAKLPSFEMDTAVAADKLLAAVREGSGTVAIVGIFDALVAKRRDPQLQLGVVLGPRQSVAFAVAQADSALLGALNTHLGQLRSAPSYRLLMDRSLGEEALQVLTRARLEE